MTKTLGLAAAALLLFAGSAMADPATATKDVAKGTGHAVAQTGRATGHVVAEGTRGAGHAVAETSRKTGHVVAKTGRKTGHALHKAVTPANTTDAKTN